MDKTLRMKTAAAVRLAGNKAELAKVLGIQRQSIQSWGEFVPPIRVYFLRHERPEWFAKARK